MKNLLNVCSIFIIAIIIITYYNTRVKGWEYIIYHIIHHVSYVLCIVYCTVHFMSYVHKSCIPTTNTEHWTVNTSLEFGVSSYQKKAKTKLSSQHLYNLQSTIYNNFQLLYSPYNSELPTPNSKCEWIWKSVENWTKGMLRNGKLIRTRYVIGWSWSWCTMYKMVSAQHQYRIQNLNNFSFPLHSTNYEIHIT